MDIDLNLENYNLKDILNLFKLDDNFNDSDLKNVKKFVIKTHPDKSGLDKEFFLFYCKAFRVLKNIYEFRNKREDTLNSVNASIEYLRDEQNESNKMLIEKMMKRKNFDFNNWFNKTFDNLIIKDDDGYGDWLKNEDILEKTIEQKRNELTKLVKHNEFIDNISYTNANSSNLNLNAPEFYTSNIFSKLNYEDVKKAHTESVIPVGEEDYNKILKFNNIEVLKQYRNSQNINPLNKKDADIYLRNKNKMDEEIATKTAYNLYKQEEQSKELNKKLWSNLKLLS